MASAITPAPIKARRCPNSASRLRLVSASVWYNIQTPLYKMALKGFVQLIKVNLSNEQYYIIATKFCFAGSKVSVGELSFTGV
jgi:hypothetical protein